MDALCPTSTTACRRACGSSTHVFGVDDASCCSLSLCWLIVALRPVFACVMYYLQACEAADYLVKLPDRIRKLSERAVARKQKTKGQTAKFSWVFKEPVELV